MSIKEELSKLNFHDSVFREISIRFPGGNARSCIIDINYYNWEGNENKTDDTPWKWERLVIEFGHLAHIGYSAPDVLNRAQDIADSELDYGLEQFEVKAKKFAANFPEGKYPLFQQDDETISIKFNTHNWDEDSCGYVWILGSKVTLTWLDNDLIEGQIHLPIKGA